MTENKYLTDGPLVAIDSTTSTKADRRRRRRKHLAHSQQNIQLHTCDGPVRTTQSAGGNQPRNHRGSFQTRRRTAAALQPSASPTSAPFAPSTRDANRSNGILWLDATEQIRRYGSEHPRALRKASRRHPAIYKMAGSRTRTEIFADAYKVMDVHGYVAWMLTGRPREFASRRGLPRHRRPHQKFSHGHLASPVLEPNLPKPHISRSFIRIDEVVSPHSSPRFLEAVRVRVLNIHGSRRIAAISLLF